MRGLTDTGSYFYYVTVGAVDVYHAALTVDGVKDAVAVAPSHSGSNISSVWSPDGRRIAYVSRRGVVGFDRLSMTLVIRDVQSGDQREIVPQMNGFMVRSWSPDGRQVLIGGTDDSGRLGRWAVNADDGRVMVIKMGEDSTRPEWLPDGRLQWPHESIRTNGRRAARRIAPFALAATLLWPEVALAQRGQDAGLLGTYRLSRRGGLNLSGVYRYQSGRITARTASFGPLTQRASILVEPRGTRQLPNVNNLDLRVEKTWKPSPRPGSLSVFADVFNVGNQGIALGITQTSGPNFFLPNNWSEPRMLRGGVRWMF